MNTARDFIKTAAILALRSKGTAQPITRSEFIAQWEKPLQEIAREVWEEVQKPDVEPNAEWARLRTCLTRLGARHTGLMTIGPAGGKHHWWTFRGKAIIIEATPEGSPVNVYVQIPTITNEELSDVIEWLK